MCFVFRAWDFHDVMTYEYLKSLNLIISRTKIVFEVKIKLFFLVSQVLSARLSKQTSKNVTDRYCSPPPVSAGRGGRGLNILPNFQKGGEGSLTESQLSKGIAGKERVTFSKGVVVFT